jgi:hypothetical protein
MQAHTPLFKNEPVRPGPAAPPVLPRADKHAPPPLPHPKRASGRSFALAMLGLALFASMGYLLGNFIIAMHIKLPWYFPH